MGLGAEGMSEWSSGGTHTDLESALDGLAASLGLARDSEDSIAHEAFSATDARTIARGEFSLVEVDGDLMASFAFDQEGQAPETVHARVRPVDQIEQERQARRDAGADTDAGQVETVDEVLDAISQWASEGPPGALYRDRTIDLSGGRFLLEIEESVPGDDHQKRRRFTVESGALPDRAFDVAVSFAGEDRTYVLEVVDYLKSQGVTVFYDVDEQAALWGRNLLEELVETYRERAFRVLMFVSVNYAEKAWPTVERRAALERSLRDLSEPFILPIRLDDTVVPGLVGTTAYVDARSLSVEQIGELTIEHLRDSGRRMAPPLVEREMAHRVSVRAIPERTGEGWRVPFFVHNGGDYPITSVIVVIDDPGSEGRAEEQQGTALEIVLGTLAPGETRKGQGENLAFRRDPFFGELTNLGVVLFTDRWGNNWATGRGTLEKNPRPPNTD
jgi:hypothetical protein